MVLYTLQNLGCDRVQIPWDQRRDGQSDTTSCDVAFKMPLNPRLLPTELMITQLPQYLITSHPGRRKGERQVVIVEGRCIFIGVEGGRGREGRTSFEVEYLSFGLVVVASQHENEERVGDDTEN